MEEKTTQATIGTWDRLPAEDIERKPKITFEINIPVKVTFLTNEPKEYPSEINKDGVFYVFDVKEGEEQKVIMTSAWSLLRALKINAPLKNKTFNICKKMIKGKQQIEVIKV